jgi:hypothetical protein
MKMGASKPILGDRQTIQNIDFFNSIRTEPPFGGSTVKSETNLKTATYANLPVTGHSCAIVA